MLLKKKPKAQFTAVKDTVEAIAVTSYFLNVEVSKISAKMEDGVLKVIIRRKSPLPKKITIE